jgi:hypothetical protein
VPVPKRERSLKESAACKTFLPLPPLPPQVSVEFERGYVYGSKAGPAVLVTVALGDCRPRRALQGALGVLGMHGLKVERVSVQPCTQTSVEMYMPFPPPTHTPTQPPRAFFFAPSASQPLDLFWACTGSK